VITNANAVAPMNSLLYHDPFNVNILLPPGPGYGRGRIAAILEACTGRSLLRPNAPRAVQQDHARKVAEARAALRLDAAPAKPRRQRKPRVRPADGLLTKEEAAAKLGCSTKTLDGYVKAGALRYVPLGHGKKHIRRMFADPDLDEFIANQTRKDVPCPSTRAETVARRISTTTSKCEVIGFTARRNARRAAKPKK
jgi:hypothetical protein